ncbi:MAG TPA: MauE/DoxX family redox-associated membrane protein [Solirubrobacteraceae bacterium]|nr:MauE/DoxX family redox-associated membrane protein [Solirubrobacteraceae bacterium]
MTEALAPPFLVASLVLCVAGLAKLRAPSTAAAAIGTRPGVIRALALGELALGLACVAHPTRVLAVALALLYGLFAIVAVLLRRRRVACGCFGDDDLPVSQAHVIASELLCALAAAAAFASPRGAGWLAGQPVATSVVLAVGIAASVYATLLVYVRLPAAWIAWSGE